MWILRPGVLRVQCGCLRTPVVRRRAIRPMTTTNGGAVGQSKLYTAIIGAVDPLVPNAMRPFWEHPAGPKTIFFWAPLFKWGLVFAGLKDLQRPAETLSLRQCASIGVTGLIWSRWSLIIIPKNYSLFACNFFVFLTQGFQAFRAARHTYG